MHMDQGTGKRDAYIFFDRTCFSYLQGCGHTQHSFTV